MCAPHSKMATQRLHPLLFASLLAWRFLHYSHDTHLPLQNVAVLQHDLYNDSTSTPTHFFQLASLPPPLLDDASSDHKWYAAEDTLEEMNALQDYVSLLAQHDTLAGGNTFLAAALDLHPTNESMLHPGRTDLIYFLTASNPAHATLPQMPLLWGSLATSPFQHSIPTANPPGLAPSTEESANIPTYSPRRRRLRPRWQLDLAGGPIRDKPKQIKSKCPKTPPKQISKKIQTKDQK